MGKKKTILDFNSRKGNILPKLSRNKRIIKILSVLFVSLVLFTFILFTFIKQDVEFIEKEIDDYRKEIIISSEKHYENILASTKIREAEKKYIKLYRTTDGIREEAEIINYVDENSNGLIDKIEWVVPSLSEQTYEIIIEISKAIHLDENKNFVFDIYEEVKEKDDIWSDRISNEEYIRVTFKHNLTSKRDITIYPRVVSGSPKIEVYEKDGNEVMATFDSISSNEYNKVLLTNLQDFQDVFDLHVVGGSVEFDHIIDPSTERLFETCTDITDWVITNGASSGWELGGGADAGTCKASNTDGETTMTSVAIDLSASDILYANVSFGRETAGLDAGEYLRVYANSSTTGTFQLILDITATNEAATSDINLSQFITLDAGVHIRFSCNVDANNEKCTIDNINVTSFEAEVDNPPLFYWNSTIPESPNLEDVLHNINWSDDTALSLNFFETNITGTIVNYTTVLSGTSQDINITNTTSILGIYYWKSYTNDSAGQWNTTNRMFVTVSDVKAPRFYFNNTNDTTPAPSSAVSHNINWTDTIALSLNFFETNITGSIVNYTTVLSGTSQDINITNTTLSTEGDYFWKSYTNDTSNNWNTTNRMFVSVETLVSDTCTYTSGDWEVDCADNCVITTDTFLDGNILNLYGTGTFTVLADISVGRLQKVSSCTIINKAGDGNELSIKTGLL